MDIWNKKKRGEVMSKILSKNTSPEREICRLLRRGRFKFRVHVKDLPGCPDIVFDKYKKVIFVHGCFWHFHKRCREGKIPKSNRRKWRLKLERNVQRDKSYFGKLKRAGWGRLVLWECDIEKDLDKVKQKINKFLHDNGDALRV